MILIKMEELLAKCEKCGESIKVSESLSHRCRLNKSMNRITALFSITILSCIPCPPVPTPGPIIQVGTKVTLEIAQVGVTSTNTPVYFSFGADSKVLPGDWSFCSTTAPLNCNFVMTGGSQELPTLGKYLNVTITFGGAVGCGTTKAELNVNNPAWYDTFDVSLVDGFSNKVAIEYKPPSGSRTLIGPPLGKSGNELLLGVYPYGCDLCTSNSAATCGIPAGPTGCKAGTQYAPIPPCQFQGSVKGGGGSVVVILVP